MGEHVNEIARRHPDVDIAVVHLGGTRVLWHTVTMDAIQGVEFASTIRARRTIPVHYDDYRVFRSSLPEFLARARLSAAGDTDIRPVRGGETVSLTPMEPRSA
jgi:L-ascorbate metabolism protein UlaG (beta-lactamase superfamily)